MSALLSGGDVSSHRGWSSAFSALKQVLISAFTPTVLWKKLEPNFFLQSISIISENLLQMRSEVKRTITKQVRKIISLHVLIPNWYKGIWHQNPPLPSCKLCYRNHLSFSFLISPYNKDPLFICFVFLLLFGQLLLFFKDTAENNSSNKLKKILKKFYFYRWFCVRRWTGSSNTLVFRCACKWI